MDPELKKLVDAVAKRNAVLSGGIATAASYVDTLGVCLDDPDCAKRFGVDAAAWAAGMKAAGETLCYLDDDMLAAPKGQPSASWGDRERERWKALTEGDPAEYAKKAKEPTAGSVMDFLCVITSTKKDRDGDVLEATGAKLDERMPLLWQHMPMLPIGKFVEAGNRNSKRVMGWFAVADTPLGNDAAFLAEFGALRISHGFKPSKWTPLEKDPKDTSPYPAGWHIEEFEVMETSFVSVPSNTDAQITAFSRGTLHHALVKQWARECWKACPKTVTSGWNPDDGPAPPLPAPTPAPAPAPAVKADPPAACAGECRCGGKCGGPGSGRPGPCPAGDAGKTGGKRAADVKISPKAIPDDHKAFTDKLDAKIAALGKQYDTLPNAVAGAASASMQRFDSSNSGKYGSILGKVIDGVGLVGGKLGGFGGASVAVAPFVAMARLLGGGKAGKDGLKDDGVDMAEAKTEGIAAWKKALKKWDKTAEKRGFYDDDEGKAYVVAPKCRNRTKRKLQPKGRFGKGDAGKLKDALEHMTAASDYDGTPKMCKTLLGKACKLAQSVLDKHGGANPGVDGKPNPGTDGSANPEAATAAREKGKVGKGDLRKLADAVDHAGAAASHEKMPKPAKTMTQAAVGQLQDVHGKHSKAKSTPGEAAARFLGHLLAGDGRKVPLPVVESIKEAVAAEVERRSEDALAELFV